MNHRKLEKLMLLKKIPRTQRKTKRHYELNISHVPGEVISRLTERLRHRG
jgi:hypothetical protein